MLKRIHYSLFFYSFILLISQIGEQAKLARLHWYGQFENRVYVVLYYSFDTGEYHELVDLVLI